MIIYTRAEIASKSHTSVIWCLITLYTLEKDVWYVKQICSTYLITFKHFETRSKTD